MTVGIFEIHATSAVSMIDRLRMFLSGIGPVLDSANTDSIENMVELILSDQKSVVLGGNRAFFLLEIEGNAVAERYDEKWAESLRLRQPQNMGEKTRRQLLVVAPDDGVV
jgi:hypothetical protein